MTLVAGFDLWYEAEQARALPSVREFMGHLPASGHFFCLPPPKRNSLLRNPKVILIAKTVEEK